MSVVFFAACKTPYDPPLKTSKTNFLVVEGFIDGAAITQIKLSRSRALSAGDTARKKFETKARVFVEDDHQSSQLLTEQGNGVYVSSFILALDPSRKYRVHIYTSDTKEYVSDFVQFKKSPAIDNIGWTIKDNGVQVYVNTHDASNTTKYYRWEYDETWEFHTAYTSLLQYDAANNNVVGRIGQVHVCWQTDSYNKILLGSSAKLTNDVIEQAPISYIEPHDQKLSVLYSINLKQFAVDVAGYNYWEAIKKNTEGIGSIFDSQPNQTVGNLHSVSDSLDFVIGYIGAGASFTKRVFISNSALPAGWNLFPFCEMFSVPNNKDSLRNFFTGFSYIPLDSFYDDHNKLRYNASSAMCSDCTISGTNIKPVYWP